MTWGCREPVIVLQKKAYWTPGSITIKPPLHQRGYWILPMRCAALQTPKSRNQS